MDDSGIHVNVSPLQAEQSQATIGGSEAGMNY
jgi:hypothetical protein